MMRTSAFILLVVGCASPPNQDQCASIVDIGSMNAPVGSAVQDGGVWETSNPYDPSASRVAYRSFTTYRVWHGLGHAPSLPPEVWASFDPTGILAQQIGNVVELVPSCGDGSTDPAHYVLLRNAGGQDFYALIVLQ